jgi:hypothetical protein
MPGSTPSAGRVYNPFIMRLSCSSIRTGIQHPIAVLLLLWFVGLGCLLGCLSHAQAASIHESGVSKHTGMSMGDEMPNGQGAGQQHDCCRARMASNKDVKNETGKSLRTSLPSSSDSQCCPLSATNGSGVAHKPRAAGEATQAPVLNTTQPRMDMPAQAAPSDNSLSLPNRGHTHLRYCVFLI